MAADGTPELAAIRCGEALAQIRTRRGWSRAQLLLRLYNELPSDDPAYLSLSETWLARLENGRMVKVPRQVVEALCRALRCTPQERAHVLLWADRNVLVDDARHTPDAAAELLTCVMDQLYREAHETLLALLRQHYAGLGSELSAQEQCELVAAALSRYLTERDRAREAARRNASASSAVTAPRQLARSAR